MRKILSVMIAVLLCLCVMTPALAAENNFVPSIGYKDGPEIKKGEMNGEDVTDCLEVTSILQAEKGTTDITPSDRDLLLDVYQKLSDGTMRLPLEGDYVIRELVDVSFKKIACIDLQHGHKEWLAGENTSVEVMFELGVGAADTVTVLTYISGQWTEVKCTNNGDGTVTCVFEDICPVAFCVKAGSKPPQTGDEMGQDLLLWIVLMAASFVCMVALVVYRRRQTR